MTTRWLIHLKGNPTPVSVVSLHNLRDVWNAAIAHNDALIHTRDGTFCTEDISAITPDTREEIHG